MLLMKLNKMLCLGMICYHNIVIPHSTLHCLEQFWFRVVSYFSLRMGEILVKIVEETAASGK